MTDRDPINPQAVADAFSDFVSDKIERDAFVAILLAEGVLSPADFVVAVCDQWVDDEEAEYGGWSQLHVDLASDELVIIWENGTVSGGH